MSANPINPYAPPEARLYENPSSLSPVDHPEGPVGLGGWLILPIIGLFLRPLLILKELLVTFLPIFQNGTWQKLTSQTSSYYHPMWAPTLIFEIAYNIIILGFNIFILILVFRKSHKAPKLYIAMLLTILCGLTLDLILSSMIPNLPKGTIQSSVIELIKVAISALIWIPYFLRSTRVKNTFNRPRT